MSKNHNFAEIILRKVPLGWRFEHCSADFLHMTGFSRHELRERFQDQFLSLLSSVDFSPAGTLFASSGNSDALCPWVFTLTCAGKSKTLPVLLQTVPKKTEPDVVCVRVHDATFLETQTEKMSRRILSLENSIPSGLCQFLCDEHFTILWHNSHLLEVLGYTEEQFFSELQCRAAGYIHPDDIPGVMTLLKNAIKKGQRMFTTEMRVICRNGDVLWILTSMSFTDETINEAPVLYSTGIDITAQKRALQMEMAMEQASSYILEYDVLARRLLASVSLQKYFGIQGNAENVPESLIESGIVIPASQETMQDIFKRLADGEEHTQGVVGIRSPQYDEEDRWFRLQLSAIYDDAGRAVKATLLAEDITEQYRIELRYREEENRRVAMTYDMDFSCQFDLSTEKIMSANESKFPFFDFRSCDSSQELIRRNAAEYVHPEDRGTYLKRLSTEYMREQFSKGVPEITLDFRAADADGNYRWTRGVCHTIKEPLRGDLCAYIYTKDISREKQREIDLRRHAEQDALTGLYNRYTVELKCDKLLLEMPEDSFSVMYMLDLDNFKYLNDTFGHFRGDEMLRQSAQCLREIFGAYALLGRLGGDELMVFQPNCESVDAAEKTVQHICERLHMLDASEGVVTVSAGIALSPQDGRTFSDLYHSSDDALYRAKRSGKNRWAFYKKELDETGPQQKDRLPVSRDWLLEESSQIIYVCDFYSYDLLYMNRGARKMFNTGDEDYVGKKCYEYLQHKDRPCEFCTNHLLCREHFYTWQFRNPVLGRSLLLRDRIVDWYGIPARIEFATDVSAMDERNQALEEQVAIDQTIITCLRVLNGKKTLNAAAALFLQEIACFYQADRAFILDYHPQDDSLRSRVEWGRPGVRSVEILTGENGIPAPDRVQKCFGRHENYSFDSPTAPDKDSELYYQVIYDGGVTCQRCVPFYVNGEPAGLLGLDNPAKHQEDFTVLETLSYFISEEMARSKLSESLAYLSYHDSLTGLWNRNRYVRYLDGLKTEALRSFGVAVADLNALKEINKLRGHSQGDLVVKRAATLLQESFPGAQIFRLSGDEFVVHHENTPRLEFLDQVKRVRENAYSLEANGISVGYAWTDREIDPALLTTQATEIMLMQKQAYYQEEQIDASLGKHSYTRLKELTDHIRNGHFIMYLQPKADCSTFRLNGAEALARFDTPETGLVSPNRFIPILEHEHAIQYVDLYMYEQVCKLLAKWQTENRELFPISLNFSRQTLLEPHLLKTLLNISDRYGVPRSLIEVEFTESLGDYESSTIAEIGAGVKSAGFRLALDDFGSHYTNMAMLSSVPTDVLKIDRGMVQNVMTSRSNQLVLKSILSLCGELGISSIAEGVETWEQLDLLRSLNCESIQGYLFGRPVPVEEFELNFL